MAVEMDQDLLALLDAPVARGRETLRATTRRLLVLSDPDLADALANDADALLEPLLFLHFANPDASQTPAQVLGGYRFASGVPLHQYHRTDHHGRIYIPRLGHVATDAIDATVEIDWKQGAESPTMRCNGERITSRVEPPMTVAACNEGRTIELLRYPVAAMTSMFSTEAGNVLEPDISTAARTGETHLRRALMLVAEAWPELSMQIAGNVSRIVLFRATGINSFAAPAAHGTSFHNLALGGDEVFLIEDLAHQCGHVIFATATQDGTEYLRNNPATSLGCVVGNGDNRSLLSALHGLVTESFMSVCLERCMRLDAFTRAQRHELAGRLAFIARRFAMDAGYLFREALLTEAGISLVSSLVASLRDVVNRHRSLLMAADFSNQSYNFDYDAYLARNPLRIQAVRTGKRNDMDDAFENRLQCASRIGFGAYRIIDDDPAHLAALSHALDLGCTLIDTSCNYGDGASERAIGRVLATHPTGAMVAVITKVGYITPSAQARLTSEGLSPETLPMISEESRYTLAPDYLSSELAASRNRLGRRCHDIVLLHNPEHLFDPRIDTGPEAGRAIIARAFEFLEAQVDAGMIGTYGISSNTMAEHAGEQLDEWMRIAVSVRADHHFKVVQFPFNMLETEASDGLFTRIRRYGLRSLCNRPLNAIENGQSVRLAVGAAGPPQDDTADYESCVQLVREQLRAHEIEHDAMDFMVMQFLRDNRHGIDHPELVDAIFHQHVAPFVARLWGDAPDGQQAFSRLHSLLRQRAQITLGEQGLQIRERCVEAGTIRADDPRPFALIACEYALRAGADHVLVGMRRVEYVETLRPLLANN